MRPDVVTVKAGVRGEVVSGACKEARVGAPRVLVGPHANARPPSGSWLILHISEEAVLTLGEQSGSDLEDIDADIEVVRPVVVDRDVLVRGVARNARGSKSLPVHERDEVIVMQPKMPVPAGYPMRVLEVSLPFAACVVIEPGGSESGPAIIDLRSFQLCRVSKEFVEAIQGFKDQNEEEDVPF